MLYLENICSIIIKLMRTTITIPDQYYLKIKKLYQAEGYNTINELILSLVRHHFDAGNKEQHQIDAHQIQVKQGEKVINPGTPKKKPKVKKSNTMCDHGYLKSQYNDCYMDKHGTHCSHGAHRLGCKFKKAGICKK